MEDYEIKERKLVRARKSPRIETDIIYQAITGGKSGLVRARGLKLPYPVRQRYDGKVRARKSPRIETNIPCSSVQISGSGLVRARGLKHFSEARAVIDLASGLVRARGLKPASWVEMNPRQCQGS